MKNTTILLTCILCFSLSLKAQESFDKLLLADLDDANKLMEAYFAPAMEGFISGMNNGWYHTAKVHKPLGFDITVGGSAAFIPTEKEIFTISGLTSLNQPSGTVSGSTIAGPNTETTLTATRSIDFGGAIGVQEGSVNFNMPGGIMNNLPLKAIPAPFVQLNIGLPYKFEGMLRGIPKANFGKDGGQINMLGLGLKKEITDWFGPVEKTPLHISLLAAFSKLNLNYNIPDSSQNSILYTQDASATFSVNTFTAQAIASLNFPIINVYGGLGYSKGTSNLKMDGSYAGTYTYLSNTATVNLPTPDVKFSTSGFRTTVGARLSLGFFKIFADYTLQEYNTLSAGVAFGLR